MATIKQLVGTEKAEELFALKDRLKAERMVESVDPMQLNRTRFEQYLSAKAEAMLLDYRLDGVDVDQAYRNVEMYLIVLDHKWREAAKVYNEAHS